jgi:hypothetical protein
MWHPWGDEKFIQCLEKDSEGKRLSEGQGNCKVNNDEMYTKKKKL